MTRRLKGKIALVTSGSRGIGRATCITAQVLAVDGGRMDLLTGSA